jgi:hypothetical protein
MVFIVLIQKVILSRFNEFNVELGEFVIRPGHHQVAGVDDQITRY